MDQAPRLRIIARVLSSDAQIQARSLFDLGDGRPSTVRLDGDPPRAGSILEVRCPPDGAPASPEDWTLLAEPGTAQAEIYNILKRHHVCPLFPRAVEAEVAAILCTPGLDEPGLVDLTALPFVTIDNEDSRDLDQALHIAREGDELVVRYALADAAHYVRPGSALFDEALRRGVSYYLPGFSVPMLPPELSEGLVSLNPQTLRRALVFVMRLDASGHSVHTDLIRARIRSRAQLSYNGVQAWFDDPEQSPLQGREFCDSLTLLREVGELRLVLARERDAVQFTRDEVEIEMLDGGRGFGVVRDLRNDVSLWNEQVSLLCNMEGARFLASGPDEVNVQAVYRIHDPPGPDQLERLAQTVARMVISHRLEPAVWRWRRRPHPGAEGESLASYLDRLPRGGATERVRKAIERQVLLANRRSSYAPEPGRHFALGVNPYSRFSSPMREIVGVFTHKEALEKLGLVAPGEPADDSALRDQVIDAANRSKDRQNQLEAEVMKLAVDALLTRDLDLPLASRPVREATVLGLKATRMYVHLDQPPVELKIYLDQLEEALGLQFEQRPHSVELRSDGKVLFRVGDRLQLRCTWYDENRGKWHLVPVS